jgi:hypothetical protein
MQGWGGHQQVLCGPSSSDGKGCAGPGGACSPGQIKATSVAECSSHPGHGLTAVVRGLSAGVAWHWQGWRHSHSRGGALQSYGAMLSTIWGMWPARQPGQSRAWQQLQQRR